jgi:hypothetical protein
MRRVGGFALMTRLTSIVAQAGGANEMAKRIVHGEMCKSETIGTLPFMERFL